ncbi:MAG: tetratricopeptide repeat protein [Isosphaeraceae bacterium]
MVGALGCVMAIGLTGCHQSSRRAEPGSPPVEQADAKKTNDGVIRTDFTPEVGPAQQARVYLGLGRAHESQGRFEAAVAEYQRAIDVSKRHGSRLGDGKRPGSDQQALAHRRLGAVLDRLGRFAEAETHYRSALRLSPDDPSVWNDAGYSEYLQGHWDLAERKLKTAAKLGPSDPRIQTNLGLALAAAGKIEPALEALTKAAGPAVAHVNLGYLLASMGKTDEARTHYALALELQPQLDVAKSALASLDKSKNPGVQVAGSTLSDSGLRRAAADPK